MSFLLDTNVVSELWKAVRGKAEHNVVAWLTAVAPESLFLSVITVFEVETGLLRLERRDPKQAVPMRNWFERRLLHQFKGRILQLDLLAIRQCAVLHVPDCMPDMDSLIAATALVHDMTIVTRNVKDFEHTGVRLINPWLS